MSRVVVLLGKVVFEINVVSETGVSVVIVVPFKLSVVFTNGVEIVVSVVFELSVELRLCVVFRNGVEVVSVVFKLSVVFRLCVVFKNGDEVVSVVFKLSVELIEGEVGIKVVFKLCVVFSNGVEVVRDALEGGAGVVALGLSVTLPAKVWTLAGANHS